MFQNLVRCEALWIYMLCHRSQNAIFKNCIWTLWIILNKYFLGTINIEYKKALFVIFPVCRVCDRSYILEGLLCPLMCPATCLPAGQMSGALCSLMCSSSKPLQSAHYMPGTVLCQRHQREKPH